MLLPSILEPPSVAAQQRAVTADSQVRLALGFGVDTATTPRREIFHVWRTYLESGPDSLTTSPHWSSAEQAQWPVFDLTAPWVYQGSDWTSRLAATVVAIRPATPPSENAYIVRTLFTRVDAGVQQFRPVALIRVYAVQEDGRWVLANAFPRLTSAWLERRFGRLTYVHPPSYPFDDAQAERAGRFVDSLVAAFEVADPGELRYYLTETPEELGRIVGLDFAIYPAGRSYPQNGLVFSGDPQAGGFYPHELAHWVLDPLAKDAPWILREGLATWVGGSRGRDYPTLVKELVAELKRRPELTLDSILEPHEWEDSVSMTTGAVFLDMINARRGLAGVRSVLRNAEDSPRGIREAVARELSVPARTLAELWRQYVLEKAQSR